MTKEITRQDFINAIKKRPFSLRACSICSYPLCCFYKGNELYCDTGCDCVNYGPVHTLTKESKLDFYLDPKRGHLENIAKFIEETDNATLHF